MMLDRIMELKASITQDQFEAVGDILGPKGRQMFLDVLDSETEEDAQARMDALSKELQEQPIVAFKLYNKLDAQQKSIVLDLMEDVE